MTGRLDYRTLGELEARADGRSIELTPSQRTLLAFLLLGANSVVPSDFLTAQLWPGDAPATSSRRLNALVIGLRRKLDDAVQGDHTVLAREDGGYALEVGTDDLDLLRFQELVEEAGRAGPGAVSLLDEALDLWDGDPLGGAGHTPALDAARSWLAALRDQAAAELDRPQPAPEVDHGVEAPAGTETPPRTRRARLVPLIATLALSAVVLGAAGLLARRGSDPAPEAAAATAAPPVAVPPSSIVKLDPLDGRVLGSVRVDGQPETLALSGTLLEVATANGTVAQLDTQTLRVVDAPVSGTNVADDSVSAGGATWRLDQSDEAVVATMPDGTVDRVAVGPDPVAIVSTGESVWVPDGQTGELWWIDAGTGQVVSRIPIPADGQSAAADSGSVWVASEADRSIVRVDAATGTVLDTIRLSRAPGAIAAGAGGVWIAIA